VFPEDLADIQDDAARARRLRQAVVGGEGFAVDASRIAADANKQPSIPGAEWNKACDPHSASRAVRE
jgi:hypothetical protein